MHNYKDIQFSKIGQKTVHLVHYKLLVSQKHYTQGSILEAKL